MMPSKRDPHAVSTGLHERKPSAVPEIPKLPFYTDFDAYFEPMMPDGLFMRLASKVEAEIAAGKEPDVKMYVARYPKYARQAFDTVVLTIENCLPDQYEKLTREVKSCRHLLTPLADVKTAAPDENVKPLPLILEEKDL
jgi:hypothetical protein